MPDQDYQPEDTVEFVNITDEEFIGRYNGKEYKIPGQAHKFYTIAVAQHFAKHLADRILQKEYDAEAIKTGDKFRTKRAYLWMDPKRFELYAQMIPELAPTAKAIEEVAKQEIKKRPAPSTQIAK